MINPTGLNHLLSMQPKPMQLMNDSYMYHRKNEIPFSARQRPNDDLGDNHMMLPDLNMIPPIQDQQIYHKYQLVHDDREAQRQYMGNYQEHLNDFSEKLKKRTY